MQGVHSWVGGVKLGLAAHAPTRQAALQQGWVGAGGATPVKHSHRILGGTGDDENPTWMKIRWLRSHTSNHRRSFQKWAQSMDRFHTWDALALPHSRHPTAPKLGV